MNLIVLREFFASFIRSRAMSRHFRRITMLDGLFATDAAKEVPPSLAQSLDLPRFNGLFRGSRPHSNFLLIGQREARRCARVWLTR